MRLCDFIRTNRPHILAQWERAVRHMPCTRDLSHPRLMDHLPMLLARVADVVETVHTGEEKGLVELPAVHALERLDVGYDLEQVAQEYAVLRACVLQLYCEHTGSSYVDEATEVVREVERFNQTLDEAMTTAVARYARARERTLVALDRIAEAALGTEDLNTFLPRLMRVLLETTESVDSVTLLLHEDGVLRVRASVGLEEEVASGFSLRVGEGFSGKIAAERRPYEVRSAATEPLVQSVALRSRGTRALYGVPLVHGEELIGVANMGSRTAYEFSSEDKLLFRAMTSRATGLLVQAVLVAREREARAQAERALERLRAQEARTVRLQEVTAALSQSLTVTDVVRVVVDKAVRALGAAGGSIGLLSEDGKWFEVTGAVGYPESELEGWARFPSDTPVMFREAVRTGELVFYETVEAFLADYPQWKGTQAVEGYQAFATLPLLVKGRALGALGLSFRERRCFACEEERAFMRVLAGQCAQALERARLHDAEQRSREELGRTAEFRERFLGVVSHDLRNPLHAILISANALLRAEDIPEPRLKSIRRVVTSAERMGRMIADLLDFTRGRLGQGIPVQLRPVSARELARQVVEELEASHPGRELRLEAEGALRGEWDGDRLTQVLGNLGKNALDYSPADTPVRFTLREEGEGVRMEVHNEGPPIPEAQRVSIFEPFQRFAREEGPSRATSGLGLGLFIVQHVVRAHGGTIAVRSSAQDGTTFSLWLPRHPGAASAAAR
jgi:signal transduction histidine kinase